MNDQPRQLNDDGYVTQQPAPGEVSFLAILNVALRYRRLIVLATLAGFAIVVALGLLKPRMYTASTMVMNQRSPGASGALGIAAQLGIMVPGSDPTQSPDFYVELLRSREILGAVADSGIDITDRTGTKRVALSELLGIKESRPIGRRNATIDALRAMIKASISDKTSVITISVRARSPVEAAAIADRLLIEINRFNLEQRQSQARQEREFVERRFNEQNAELRQAENRLQEFLQTNREWRNSPKLVMDEDRLSRDVSMRQQLATSMAQSFEQAKIEQVRDMPVITVIERAEPPLDPDPRGLAFKAILGAMAGALFGLFIAFVRQWVGRDMPAGSTDAQEFGLLRRAAIDDLLHPWRPVTQMIGLSRRPTEDP